MSELRTVTPEELKKVLADHKLWLEGSSNGKRANLGGADLERANLREADLRRADLRRADLREADLRRAYLERANLREADLRRADLRRANLWGAYLEGANLRDADLTRSRGLRHASICFTGFGECDRKLKVVGLPGGLTYFCGCFKGSETDLREYIDRGEDDLRESRLAGLECLKTVLKFSEPST